MLNVSVRQIPATAVFLVVLGAGHAAPLQAQFDGPGAHEVRDAELAFAQTMADRDLAAFLTFVSPEAVIFNGSTPHRGIAAIEEDWSRFFEEPEAPFSWSPDVVQVLESGTLALSSGEVLSPAGDVIGRFNSIWKKGEGGTWQVVFDKGSPP